MAADIDIYLFALMEGDIDKEEYLLLIEEFDNTCMKQSRFPYEEYDPFDWNALDKLICKTKFRFEKNDVPESGVMNDLEQHAFSPNGTPLCVYIG